LHHLSNSKGFIIYSYTHIRIYVPIVDLALRPIYLSHDHDHASPLPFFVKRLPPTLIMQWPFLKSKSLQVAGQRRRSLLHSS
jgi:hypothetical protein